MLRDPVGPRAPKQPSFTSNFRDWWKLRSDPNNTAKAERLWSLLLVVFFPVVVIGGNWRGGVRCSETPWGQGRPNTTYPMGRLRVLHGLRCRWVGTVAVVVGGRGSRWGGGLSGRGKGYPCEGVGCGKGGWGERCWSRTLVGCRRVQAVNFPEVWISKVGTVTVICKILQGLRRGDIWDHTVWLVRFVVLLSDTVPWAIRSEGPGR